MKPSMQVYILGYQAIQVTLLHEFHHLIDDVAYPNPKKQLERCFYN